MKCSLDADGEALCLGRPLPDQVRPAAVGLQEVVRLLALHVPRKPKEEGEGEGGGGEEEEEEEEGEENS